MSSFPVVWALIDERPGTGKQSSAVAKSLGLPYVEKRLTWSKFANFPSWILGPSLLGLTSSAKSEVKSPWPDVVIASGRRAALVARYIKKQSLNDCRLIQIMYPGDTGIGDFDLVVVPKHDGETINGANILRITGAPQDIDENELAAAHERWQNEFTAFDKPLVGLIVGGATKRRSFSQTMAIQLARETAELVQKTGGSLTVTSSPRTGEVFDAILAELRANEVEPAYAFQWSSDVKEVDNPYLGFLAHADQLIVTGESSSMCSEVCTLGKPIHIFAPTGFLAAKHQHLVDELVNGGYACLLGTKQKDNISDNPEILNVVGTIADEIKARRLVELD